MAKQVILTGSSPNDKTGDKLRDAFNKINANFTELYATTGADAAANELVNGTKIVSLGSTGILTLPSSSYLESTNVNLKIGAQGTVTIRSNAASNLTTKSWTFGVDGSLAVPTHETVTFTAVCDTAHMVIPTGLTGDAWSFEVSFVVNANGTVETQITNNTPWPSNPGYANGKQFTYTVDDHGIPGYTFTLTMTDIQNPGMFMYTTNLAASQSPEYPSTVESTGAVKLTSNNNSWTFSTDGKLILPAGGDIVDSNGNTVLNTIIDGGTASTTF